MCVPVLYVSFSFINSFHLNLNESPTFCHATFCHSDVSIKRRFVTRLFITRHFATTTIRHNDNLSRRRFVTTTICLDDNLYQRQFVTTTICHDDFLSLRQFVSTTFCINDNLSLRKFVSTTICINDNLTMTIHDYDNLSHHEILPQRLFITTAQIVEILPIRQLITTTICHIVKFWPNDNLSRRHKLSIFYQSDNLLRRQFVTSRKLTTTTVHHGAICRMSINTTISHDDNLSHHKNLPQIIQIITTKQYNLSPLTLTNQKDNFIPWTA